MSLQPDEPSYLPPIVLRMVEHLRKATAHEPEIRTVSQRHWRIGLINGPVEVVINFKRTSSGRYPPPEIAFRLDGILQRSKRRLNLDDFIWMFLHPGEPLEPPLPALPPATPVEYAPYLVRLQYRELANRLGENELSIGRTQRGWTIGLETPTASVRLNYVPAGTRDWIFDPRMPIQVVKDGVDRSDEVQGDIAKLVAVLTNRAPSSTTPGSGAVSGPADAARSNAVETRQGTVIRN